MFDKFSERHIGVSNEKDLKAMLDVIGVKSVDELISQVIPQSIRLRKPLALPAEGMSEYEFAAHIRELADRNQPYRSFIGMGYYPSAVPAVVTRNVFENPAWYTSYTPYQAEISQGRLEALLNFQTAVISLTGMEIGNCSLLDEGTAAAEAMAMMFSLRSRDAVREGRNQLFVDRNIFPQTLDVLLTRSEPFGIELIVDEYDEYEFTGREFGAIVQYPAADGRVRDYSDFTAAAHAKGALVTVAADLLSLALLKAPGEWGADIAVGSAQRLGTPMGFGGPAAGYMTTREAFKRNMPGRIIGVSVDRLGNKALRMALQMREQHIKRERATSNICTASALMASMTGFYCVYNGPEGLRRAAETAHLAAATVARALEAMDYRLASKEFFDTLEVEAEAAVVQSLALEQGINFYYPSEGRVRMSFDEVTTAAEIETVVSIFAAAKGKKAKAVKAVTESCVPTALRRQSPYLQEPVFNAYRSESALMRYIKKLELRDISLANSMISLGSCTMKLNAAALMQPLSLAGFQNMHPFAPADQAKGYMDLIAGLPADTPEGFRRTLDTCLTFGADNITVHTLSLKKGSRILLEGLPIPSAEDVAAMLDYADPALREKGFAPYYLYRQKYMSGSFENVGWCISGAEGLYNIYIMEELHSILSLGAGGSTKMVDAKRNRIERVFHPKFPLEYIQRPEKLTENLEAFRRFHQEMAR